MSFVPYICESLDAAIEKYMEDNLTSDNPPCLELTMRQFEALRDECRRMFPWLESSPNTVPTYRGIQLKIIP